MSITPSNQPGAGSSKFPGFLPLLLGCIATHGGFDPTAARPWPSAKVAAGWRTDATGRAVFATGAAEATPGRRRNFGMKPWLVMFNGNLSVWRWTLGQKKGQMSFWFHLFALILGGSFNHHVFLFVTLTIRCDHVGLKSVACHRYCYCFGWLVAS